MRHMPYLFGSPDFNAHSHLSEYVLPSRDEKASIVLSPGLSRISNHLNIQPLPVWLPKPRLLTFSSTESQFEYTFTVVFGSVRSTKRQLVI